MAIDVVTEIVIDRPRDEVAAYAADPDRAPEWYFNISSVEWETAPRAVAAGARIAFVARFLAQRLAYTYEIVEHVPGERLVMRTPGPAMAMETTYTWEPAGDGRTRMTLRNRGELQQLQLLSSLISPLMAAAVRRANRKDLERLKRILERG